MFVNVRMDDDLWKKMEIEFFLWQGFEEIPSPKELEEMIEICM